MIIEKRFKECWIFILLVTKAKLNLSKIVKNIGKELLKVVLICSLFFVVLQVVDAQTPVLGTGEVFQSTESESTDPGGLPLFTPGGSSDDQGLGIIKEGNNNISQKIINYLNWIVGIITVLIIIYSAIKLIVADGDEANLGNAKMTLIYAVMGLLLLVLMNIIIDNVLFVNNKWWKQSVGDMRVKLTTNVIDVLEVSIRYLGTIIASLFIVISATRMVLAQGDESVYEKSQKQIIYAVAGLIVVMLADDVVRALYKNSTGEWIGWTAEATATLNLGKNFILLQIVDFLKYLLGGIASFVVILSGVKMVTANNDEGVFTQSRKNLVEALIGLAVVILASTLIIAIYWPDASLVWSWLTIASQGSSLVDLILGNVGGFIKIIVIGISVIVMVLSGMKIAMGTEEERAKSKIHLSWAVVGFTFIIIAEPILKMAYWSLGDGLAFKVGTPYGDLAEVKQGLNENLTLQMFKLLEVLEKVMALIAVAVLIIWGGVAVAKIGDESVMETVKKYVTNAIIGLIIVSLSSPIIAMFFGNIYKTTWIDTATIKPQVTEGVKELVGLTNYVLGFLSILSLGMVIYGGALIATARDDKDQVNKGKTIIINFTIGVIIIIMAWTIVETIIQG